MARIAGVDIPIEKRVEVSLTYIYGIGRASAKKVLAEAKVNPDTRVKDLSEEEVARIRKVIEKKYRVEGERRRMVTQGIKRLKDIGSYRGIRHQKKLPVRGQRTRTNARTKRGKKRTIGGMKRTVQKK